MIGNNYFNIRYWQPESGVVHYLFTKDKIKRFRPTEISPVPDLSELPAWAKAIALIISLLGSASGAPVPVPAFAY